jgi:hypothetical protein
MEKLSQKIVDFLAQHAANGVTLGQLLDMMGKQGAGFLLALLALPLMVPLPPGMATPFAVLLFVWSLQRLFGVSMPWYPKFLRNKHLSSKVLEKLARKGIPLIQKLERQHGGKGTQMSETAEKSACIVVMIMSILIILPTPFLNPLFAFVILLLGVSMAGANIRFFITGIIVGTAIVLLLLTILVKTIQDDNFLLACMLV